MPCCNPVPAVFRCFGCVSGAFRCGMRHSATVRTVFFAVLAGVLLITGQCGGAGRKGRAGSKGGGRLCLYVCLCLCICMCRRGFGPLFVHSGHNEALTVECSDVWMCILHSAAFHLLPVLSLFVLLLYSLSLSLSLSHSLTVSLCAQSMPAAAAEVTQRDVLQE